jgi:hypothetical protein
MSAFRIAQVQNTTTIRRDHTLAHQPYLGNRVASFSRVFPLEHP